MTPKELRTYICKRRLFQHYAFGDKMKPDDEKKMQNYMDDCVVDKERLRWYSQPSVLFEAAKALIYREANFQDILHRKSPIRWLNIRSVDYLAYNFFSYAFLEQPMSMHRSLAVYKNMPHFPDGPGRGEYIKREWTEPRAYLDHMVKRDIIFDVDADTYNQGRRWAKKLFKFLNGYNVRFTVMFSGKKGWHFILADSPQLQENGKFNPKQTTELNKALVSDLNDHLNIQIDPVPAGIPISYSKCIMSLDGRNNRVILPLTKEQFEGFDLDMVSTDYILKNIKIRDRGLCINNTGNEDNVREMIGAI